MSLITAADMRARYDERLLGDLLSDDGSRLVGDALDNSSKLDVLLKAASGQVHASLFPGQRYTQTEIDALPEESAEFLKTLACGLCWAMLWRRKPQFDPQDTQRKEALEEGEQIIKLLREGQIVLDVEATKEAGLPEFKAVDAAMIDRRNLMVDRVRQAGRFYLPRHFPR